MMDAVIQATAARFVRLLKTRHATVTVAESCTGGLLASTFTDIAGASAWFKKSWVTYANEAKVEELNVSPEDLKTRGAVSAQVAIQMAKGALAKANATFAISVTGIAGPTNEGSSKPIGTVYVGIATDTWANAIHTQIGGTRSENKRGFVHFALLTALRCFDEAMEREAQKVVEEHEAMIEAARLEALAQAEREEREQKAREEAPWQDEAWSEEQEEDAILEVEWSDGEE